MARFAWVLIAVLAAASACGRTGSAAKVHSYAGPLYVRGAAAKHPGAGAAGNVVDCRTWRGGGFSAAKLYQHGATADSPGHALETARHEGIFDGPWNGLQIAKRERTRVLYVLDVGGAVKQAVIVHNGPATKGAGGAGWYVESWASCDYSEFPRSFTDSIGVQIWTDSAGNPAPTTRIQSWRGPEHCDWQSMTFLEIGRATYVRAPQPYLDQYFAQPYRKNTNLPGNALDTGFRRDGHELWLSHDKQIAYMRGSGDVEAWPRTIRPLLCG